MSDLNLVDFYGRIARIERAHTKGLGFEATGTLGRSYYMRKTQKRRFSLLPLLFIVIAAIGLKAVIYQNTGADTYQLRVAQLLAGEGFEPVGGWLMQADPLTIYLSEQIARGVVNLRS